MKPVDKIKDDLLKKRITTIETVKKLWLKTYNTEGKPDWSHILPYYVDLFINGIEKIF